MAQNAGKKNAPGPDNLFFILRDASSRVHPDNIIIHFPWVSWLKIS
jgi:hypothetical protein